MVFGNFNSTIVRLIVLLDIAGLSYIDEFQFNHCTINRVNRNQELIIQSHFNSTIVRLIVADMMHFAYVRKFQFNHCTINSFRDIQAFRLYDISIQPLYD